MPVPASIDDLSTTPGSNSPGGSETPKDGDNYIRSQSAFIALLRDKLDGTSGGATLSSPTIDGTPDFTGTAVTWSGGGVTHSGNHVYSGSVSFLGGIAVTGNDATYTPALVGSGTAGSWSASTAVGRRTSFGARTFGSFFIDATVSGSPTGTLLLSAPTVVSAVPSIFEEQGRCMYSINGGAYTQGTLCRHTSDTSKLMIRTPVGATMSILQADGITSITISGAFSYA